MTPCARCGSLISGTSDDPIVAECCNEDAAPSIWCRGCDDKVTLYHREKRRSECPKIIESVPRGLYYEE